MTDDTPDDQVLEIRADKLTMGDREWIEEFTDLNHVQLNEILTEVKDAKESGGVAMPPMKVIIAFATCAVVRSSDGELSYDQALAEVRKRNLEELQFVQQDPPSAPA